MLINIFYWFIVSDNPILNVAKDLLHTGLSNPLRKTRFPYEIKINKKKAPAQYALEAFLPIA